MWALMEFYDPAAAGEAAPAREEQFPVPGYYRLVCGDAAESERWRCRVRSRCSWELAVCIADAESRAAMERADGDEEEEAEERWQAKLVSQDMAAWVWEHRAEFLLEFQTAEEAVAEALTVPRAEWLGKPALVHETSDNPGGGATGDATFLLDAMLNTGFAEGVRLHRRPGSCPRGR